MQIQQLSAQLDQKLRELDERLNDLDSQRDTNGDEREQARIVRDIAALEATRQRLEKSRDLAWRAHNLQQQDKDLLKVRRLNRLAIGLMAISCIAGFALLGYWIFLEFGS